MKGAGEVQEQGAMVEFSGETWAQRVSEKLGRAWAPVCSLCKQGDFDMAMGMEAAVCQVMGGPLEGAMSVVPCYLLICKTCGRVERLDARIVSGIQMGPIQMEEEAPEEPRIMGVSQEDMVRVGLTKEDLLKR